MAVLSIVMKRKVGGSFDTLYPKTTATQVITDTSNRFVGDSDITNWNGKIDGSEKGANSGVCPLDANGKIAVSFLPAEAKEVQIVADITARDGIATPYSGLEVLVLDASSEADVDSGWAKYIYNGASYVKIGEEESLDAVVASVDWTSITGKPTSSVANIDQAVTDSHTHGNTAVLDGTTESFTIALKSAYDGAVSAQHTHANSATLDAIEEAFTTALKTIYDGYSTIFVQAGEPGTAVDGDFWYETV